MSEGGNYEMNHERRGIALVINIRSFDAPNPDELEERLWSMKDVENLEQTLKYLEFKVILCQNYTKNQIELEIQKQASKNHSQSDCFLCVVMSHGNEDKIVTYDNREISFEEIMAPIKECPSLENKPKLFFFQACRGGKKMASKAPKPTPPEQARISSAKGKPAEMTDHQPQQQKMQNVTTKPKDTNIDNESDLLIYYSTLPNHLSFSRDIEEGTIFIKSVCDVFSNEAYKNLPNNNKLSQMILNINHKVKQQGLSLADPINRLTKEVHFLPKNVRRILFIFILYAYRNPL